MTIAAIREVVGGKWYRRENTESEISNLLVDSRQLKFPSHTMFFAIEGLRQNGHHFIPDLFDRGVRAFVVTKDVSHLDLAGAAVIRVENAIIALQILAGFHRRQFSIPVIGITGSNGKTVVKEWLHYLLRSKWKIISTPKSYNSQIGVPLSVWQLNDACDLAIFEAGISKPGEMEQLRSVIDPTFGIFTNLGTAHAEGFVDDVEKAREKASLFRHCNQVVYCHDHKVVHRTLVEENIPTYSWSLHDDAADLRIYQESKKGANTQFRLTFQDKQYHIQIPFYDHASIENACHCIAILCLLEKDLSPYISAFGSLPTVEMRLEVKQGINRCLIMNDAYSADLESLSVALSFARQQGLYRRKTAILTDLEQQADTADRLYSRVGKLLIEHEFTRVIAIGSDIEKLSKYLNHGLAFTFYPSVHGFLDQMPSLIFEDELILIKGARTYGLEVVANRLELKQHHTVLEINLGALARNLKIFETRLQVGVHIMAMVKAAAYGSGSVEIARFLASRNIDYLAVAYADEGVQLRKSGVELPVMVLNSDAGQLPLLLEYSLEPEVFSLDQLKELCTTVGKHPGRLDIHLKVETGMYRLGLDESQIDEALKVLGETPTFRVKSVFSHLAASESAEEDFFTKEQIKRFEFLYKRISSGLGTRPLRHILNSNGIIRHPDAQYEMVRLGIGMYGIGMPDHMHLEKVHTLKTFVAQIKEVPAGSTIGYGRMEKVKQRTTIATLGIGYADGLIRKAGNRRYAVVIEGQLAPIVGNVCMDMTMVDVTGIPGVSVKTPVTIFGESPTIDDLAAAGETIPYEVFTNLSERVKRVYTYE